MGDGGNEAEWDKRVAIAADAILGAFDWDKDGTGMGNLLFAACQQAGFDDPHAIARAFATGAARAALFALNDLDTV